MKCVVLGHYIRHLGKAIQALAKVGEEIYIEPHPDGLAFKTVNSSRSALMTFKFSADFFEDYIEKCDDDLEAIQSSEPETSSQNPSKCRLMMRSILMVFKNVNSLEKNVEKFTMQVFPKEFKVRVNLDCRFSVTKRYIFNFLDSERLDMAHETPEEGNTFTCQAKVLNEAALNFLKNQEEVTMLAYADKFVMKNYLSSSSRENQTAVHTELTMHSHEFESYNVHTDCSITYCLKELRSIIGFADALSLPLTAMYGASNDPIFFNVTHSDLFEGALIMATVAIEDPHSRDTTMDSSQGNSTFRNTEDLLGREDRIRPEKRKSHPPSSPVIRRVSATQSSSRSTQRSGIEETTQPRTSTCDLNKGSPPRFSQGLQDVLDDTRILSQTQSPPSKRARYLFKRCFEKTMDLQNIPGSNIILAPDSDEEN